MFIVGYDRLRSPSFFNDTASEYDGLYSSTTTLKRQHSQLIAQPEIQHAVLLHPEYENQKPIRSTVSMLNLSQPYSYNNMRQENEKETHANEISRFVLFLKK